MTRHIRKKIGLIMGRKTRLKITLKRHMLELKGHFMMRKGLMHQEDMVPINNTCPKMEQ